MKNVTDNSKENILTKFYQIDWNDEIVESIPIDENKHAELLAYYHHLFQHIKINFMLVREQLGTSNTIAKANIVRVLEYFWAKALFHHYHFYKKYNNKFKSYFPVKIRRHGYRKSNITLEELITIENIFAKFYDLKK